jgi:hypothetical protein
VSCFKTKVFFKKKTCFFCFKTIKKTVFYSNKTGYFIFLLSVYYLCHPVLPTATTEHEIKEPSESEGVSSDAESFYGFELDSDDGNESSQSMVESEEN